MVSAVTMYQCRCDKCGKEYTYFSIKQARRHGWKITKTNNKSYCAECMASGKVK